MTQAYAIRGRAKAPEPYHYPQCGLDDVFLLNGYARHQTPYGDGVTVENVEGLHEAIAQHLCLNKAFLNGKEFRFLRKLLDLTQAELGVALGCDVQSVARWEKGKTDINGAADKLLRLLYLTSREGKVDAAELIKSISALDAKITDRQVFEDTPEGWKAAA
jgi:DNA-binding transcriptional regulator YiaG